MVIPKFECIKIIHNADDFSIQERFAALRSLIQFHDENYVASRFDYEKYLYSDFWQVIKDYLFFKSDWRCQRCQDEVKRWKMQVHHHTYRHLFKEVLWLDDIILVCDKCHKELHEIDEEVEEWQDQTKQGLSISHSIQI